MRYPTHMLTSITGAVALSQVTELPLGIAFTVGVLVGSLLPDVDEPNSYIGRKTSVELSKKQDGSTKRFGVSSIIKKIFGHRGFTHSLLAAFLVFIPFLLLMNQENILGIEDKETTFLELILLGATSWIQLGLTALLMTMYIIVIVDIIQKVVKKMLPFVKAKPRRYIKSLSLAGFILLSLLAPVYSLLPILLGTAIGYLFHIVGDMFSKSGVPLFHPISKMKIKIPLYVTGKLSEKIVFGVTVVLLIFMMDKSILEWFMI